MKRRKLLGLMAAAVSLPNLVIFSIKKTPDLYSTMNDYFLELGEGFYDSVTNYKVAQQVGKELNLHSYNMHKICSETFGLEHKASLVSQRDIRSRLNSRVKSDFEENKIFRCGGWIMSQTEAKLIWLLNENKYLENHILSKRIRT